MNLANFLNKIFTQDGFILIDYYSKKYQIGKPIKDKPINLKITATEVMERFLMRN